MNQKILEVVLDLKDKFTPKIKGTADSSNRALGSLMNTVKGLFAGLLSLEVLRRVGMWMKDAALEANRYNRSLLALKQMTSDYGVSVDVLINKLHRASMEQLSYADAVQASNRAIALIGPQVIPQLDELIVLSTKAAQVMGTTVTEAFDSFTLALGRQSKMILDNLGIIMSVEEANSNYATSLGKTVEALTESERKQAFMNAALEKATELYADIEIQVDKVEKLNTAWDNFTITLGQFVIEAPAVVSAIDWITNSIINATNALRLYNMDQANAPYTPEQESEMMRSMIGTMVGGTGIPSAADITEARARLEEALMLPQTITAPPPAGAGGGVARAIEDAAQRISDTSTIFDRIADILQRIVDRIQQVADQMRYANDVQDRLFGARYEVPPMSLFGPGIDALHEMTMGRSARGVIGAPGYIGPGFDVTAAEQGFFGMQFPRTEPKVDKVTGQVTRFTNDLMQNIFASAIGGFASGGAMGGITAALPLIGSAFGPIGGAVGGFLSSIIGGKKGRGDTPSNPIYTKIINPEDLATAFLSVTKGLISAGGAAGLNALVQDIRAQAQRINAS